MITFCPKADDDHAPFPHRLVTVSRNARDSDNNPVTITSTFVICAACDHWTGTRVHCDCAVRCHETSQAGMIKRNSLPRKEPV